MRLLHTADWHVGVTIRGRSRLEEHREVLNEIVQIADDEGVDCILVAGDVFHHAGPSPEAEGVVLDALMEMRREGRQVVVLAGNHDHPGKWESYRGVLGALGITVLGVPRAADNGGVLSFYTAAQEQVNIALMPFLSKRRALPIARLLGLDGDERERRYSAYVEYVAKALGGGFRAGDINISTGHLAVVGGMLDGTEREAQSILDYVAPPSVFPECHYVALGHLHRAQRLSDSLSPMYYAGSIVKGNFGEEKNVPSVRVVEAAAGFGVSSGDVREIPLSKARQLLTIRGGKEDVRLLADEAGDAYIRVVLEEQVSPGDVLELRDRFGLVVDVSLAEQEEHVASADSGALSGKSPVEMFGEYLSEQEEYSQGDREELLALFNEIADAADEHVHVEG